ncbi:putative acetyltransferase [Nocardioides dokdonensis FR1436]|uniref:Putative acetyltransferase n=1 Tax=Nocardioides dokdonensis FR1436 TaxID=1300347 RepID=A0A1A9GRJ1_9ACTN|nr:GNAT family N-acetyltransferase [Nocardioides dokdonensis]ANH40075.1 putative acetyltransferase [Nocardioides dokdonensis FR1436]
MSRSPVTLRTASEEDALFLVELWEPYLRRGDREDQVADLERVIKESAASPEQRLLIADHDGRPAGAVLLCVATLSPINLEPVVQFHSPTVVPDMRRHGVGRTLVEAAVAWAEDLGIPHVATEASATSRDANRFMARLALRPQAVLRAATTHAIRTKVEAQRPATERGRSARGQMLAARRSLRRQQAG